MIVSVMIATGHGITSEQQCNLLSGYDLEGFDSKGNKAPLTTKGESSTYENGLSLIHWKNIAECPSFSGPSTHQLRSPSISICRWLLRRYYT
jgi:hypothetical protein